MSTKFVIAKKAGTLRDMEIMACIVKLDTIFLAPALALNLALTSDFEQEQDGRKQVSGNTVRAIKSSWKIRY